MNGNQTQAKLSRDQSCVPWVLVGTCVISSACCASSCGWESQLKELTGEGLEEQNLFLLPGSGTVNQKRLVWDLEGQKGGLHFNADKLPAANSCCLLCVNMLVHGGAAKAALLLGVEARCLHSWDYCPQCTVEASTTPKSPLTRTKRKTVSN